MNRLPARPALGLALALAVLVPAVAQQPLAYPPAPKKPVSDVYHGVKVTDEYRWLENKDDAAVRRWIDEQNVLTRAFIDKIPARKQLEEQLEKLMGDTSPSYGGLQIAGGTLFALKRQPPKEQPMLITLKSVDDPESARVLLDPNALDAKGKTAIDFFTPSPDGKLLAVSLSEGGSEIGALSLYEVATMTKRPDVIPRITNPTAGGSIAWSLDGSGFFYTRYPRGNERPKEDVDFYQQVYYHQLGTSTENDRYEIGKDFPRIAEIFLDMAPDGRHLLATVQKGDGGEFTHHLRGPDGKWAQLTQYADEINAVAFGAKGDNNLYLLSRKGAPRGKILKLPVGETDLAKAVTVVPESDVAIVGLHDRGTRMSPSHLPTPSGLYVLDVAGGPSQLRFFPRSGRPANVPLPPVAAVNDLVPLQGDQVLVNVNTFTKPAAWYRYAPGDAELRPTALVRKSPASFDDIEVTRLFATSKDGTNVPMTVLHKKGIKLDGNNPTLLYAYGGYGIIISPSFNAARRVWFDRGGVYAVANLRGGSEYGEPWHKAAVLTKRQNAYDDFFACARLLVDKGYTKPERLAIEGGSNGGLLMGVALTQHPELFRAVVSHVGIYDMLRVELSPNGAFNVTEFGTVKELDQFKALYAYSPLHHVKDKTPYPAVLLLTGVNDGRVDPSNSYKMAARLQAAAASGRPVLLRVTFGSGHGIGASLSEAINRTADVYTFLFHELGMGT
jgi:prolyl oligopeptidase